MRKLIIAALALILAGAVLHFLGICPIVKRIWTPSWTLFSGGLCFLLLTIFYGLIDVAGYRRWAFLFVVIGMNSIAAYLMSWTLHAFLVDALQRHFGRGVFQIFGEHFADALIGGVVLTIFCLVLLWMYRRKIFLRI